MKARSEGEAGSPSTRPPERALAGFHQATDVGGKRPENPHPKHRNQEKEWLVS